MATRWYRAPELLLGPPFHDDSTGSLVQYMYSAPIDMWAIGCLMVGDEGRGEGPIGVLGFPRASCWTVSLFPAPVFLPSTSPCFQGELLDGEPLFPSLLPPLPIPRASFWMVSLCSRATAT